MVQSGHDDRHRRRSPSSSSPASRRARRSGARATSFAAADAATVGDVAARLGLEPGATGIVLVNGLHAARRTGSAPPATKSRCSLRSEGDDGRRRRFRRERAGSIRRRAGGPAPAPRATASPRRSSASWWPPRCVCVALVAARMVYSHTIALLVPDLEPRARLGAVRLRRSCLPLSTSRRVVVWLLIVARGSGVAAVLPQRPVHPHGLPAPRQHGRHRARLVRRADALLVRVDGADARRSSRST